MWCSRPLRLRSSARLSGPELRRNNAAPNRLARPVPITSFPDWSSIRRFLPPATVAFAWEGEGGDNFDIYVRSIDGSSQQRLTTDAAADHAPAWSPDGQRIAFVRILRKGERLSLCRRSAVPSGGYSRQGQNALVPRRACRTACRGRRMASSWSSPSVISPPPATAINLYSLTEGHRRQSHIRLRISANSSGRFSGWPISRIRSRRWPAQRQHVRAEARAVAPGRGACPTDIRPRRAGVRLDARTAAVSSMTRAFVGAGGLWRVAVGRRGARARVTEHQGKQALGRALGAAHRLSEMSIDSNIWGNCPRRPRQSGSPQGTRPFASSRLTFVTQIIGSHRMAPESHSPLQVGQPARLGVEPRRIRAAPVTNFEGFAGSPR